MAFKKQTHCNKGHELTNENTRWATKENGKRRRVCRTCNNEYHRLRQEGLRDDGSMQTYWRWAKIKQKYGVSQEMWQAMFDKQGGRCAGCMKLFGKERHEKACVDHNHETGVFRGLLCHSCNRSLGLLKESITTLQTLILYLQYQGG